MLLMPASGSVLPRTIAPPYPGAPRKAPHHSTHGSGPRAAGNGSASGWTRRCSTYGPSMAAATRSRHSAGLVSQPWITPAPECSAVGLSTRCSRSVRA